MDRNIVNESQHYLEESSKRLKPERRQTLSTLLIRSRSSHDQANIIVDTIISVYWKHLNFTTWKEWREFKAVVCRDQDIVPLQISVEDFFPPILNHLKSLASYRWTFQEMKDLLWNALKTRKQLLFFDGKVSITNTFSFSYVSGDHYKMIRLFNPNDVQVRVSTGPSDLGKLLFGAHFKRHDTLFGTNTR
jgi:hypothetical protein